MTKKLYRILLFNYGELRNAKALAKTIVEAREIESIKTSFQLKENIKKILAKITKRIKLWL